MHTKFELLKEIFDIERVDIALQKCEKFTTTDLLKIISQTTYSLREEMPCSVATTTKWLKVAFPDRPATSNRLDTYLLHKYGYKECKHCILVKYLEDFHKNASTKDGLNAYCKDCQNILTAVTSASRQAKYAASKIQRTPPWVSEQELQEISLFYKLCPKGYHVDHIIPLQGVLVSGLHVLINLRYLLASENCSKSNKFIPY